ncbi:MAG: hypothetical protein HC837_20430, partial [Chloroflexaceae bacterium]|nr:hypothetical protein [Chloroflexaceae bacterium]
LVDSPDVNASAAAWSPNGTLIAFERRIIQDRISSNPAIWLAQPDGTSFGPVTESDQRGIAPVWSPDSSKLAFTETTSQTVTVYAFTSAFQTFAESSGEPVTWSPDSTALLYTSSAGQLWHAELASDQRGGLPLLPDSRIGQVAWSPNGEWVVLVQLAESTAMGTLWRMRLDGSDLQQLSPPDTVSDHQPIWSPDSQQIAFLRGGNDGTNTAWVLDLMSGAQHMVFEDVLQVAWLP